jgi:predicted nucleotidyltransferase
MDTTYSPKIKEILSAFGVRRAGIFGSQARQSATLTSDLDLLVELDDGASLFDVIRLKHALEDELHIDVDLVEYKAIKPLLRDSILHDEIRIL